MFRKVTARLDLRGDFATVPESWRVRIPTFDSEELALVASVFEAFSGQD